MGDLSFFSEFRLYNTRRVLETLSTVIINEFFYNYDKTEFTTEQTIYDGDSTKADNFMKTKAQN